MSMTEVRSKPAPAQARSVDMKPPMSTKFPSSIRRSVLAAAAVVASGLALHAALAQQVGSKRTDLQRHDLSIPGREVIQARVDLDPGEISPRHTHPGEEIIYVLEGSIEYQVAGKPPMTLKPGDVLFIPAGTVHAAKNVGRGNAAELGTYVVEKGKPLITVVQ